MAGKPLVKDQKPLCLEACACAYGRHMAASWVPWKHGGLQGITGPR